MTLFLLSRPLSSDDARTYTALRPAERRPFASQDGRHGQGQADLSTEQPPSREDARVQDPDADARGPGDPGAAEDQGPHPTVRLIGAVMRSREVERVFAEGRSTHGNRVVLFVAPGSGGTAVVAARKVGTAVERNRARRILRAAWREVAPTLEKGYDVVLVARQGIRGAKTQDLVAEMTELLRRAEAAST